jgi:hypothetical protein
MSQTFYADMHCHPQGRAFNYFRNNPEKLEVLPNEFPVEWSPWVLPSRDCKLKNWSKQIQGKRPGSFSQADFNRLAAGNVRLVFASLYPLETGFVKKESKTLFGKLIKGMTEPLSILLEALDARGLAQSLQMRYPVDRIKFFQGKSNATYDYWEETKLEYYFLAARDGVHQSHAFTYYSRECHNDTITEEDIIAERIPSTIFPLDHSYEIVQSKTHLETLLRNEKKIAVVLTVEGGHVFSVTRDNKPESWSVVQSRLRELKHWGRKRTDQATSADLKNPEALRHWMNNGTGAFISNPIFILNLSHHFNNYLAAHARSLPDKLRLIMDQSKGIDVNHPLSDIGRKVIESCLNIRTVNSNGVTTFENVVDGNRILIDVKHMNPASRKVYYNEFIIPYNKQNPDKHIPVIATHIGVVGHKYPTLDSLKSQELISFVGDLFKRNSSKEGFTVWGINMCLEDIEVICKSSGMIALSIDQRILGNATGKSHAEDFVRNLKFIINEAKKSNYRTEAVGDSVWDVTAIASDFDGFIDPIDCCPSTLCYTQLRQEIVSILKSESLDFFTPYSRDICMDKLFGLNAFEFTQKHFPETNTPDIPLVA